MGLCCFDGVNCVSTPKVGVPSLSWLPWSVGITSVMENMAGSRESGSQAPSAASFLLMASNPSVLFATTLLPLLGSAKMGERRDVCSPVCSTTSLLVIPAGTTMLFNTSQPLLPNSTTRVCEEGSWLLRQGCCFWAPYLLGHMLCVCAIA